MSLFRKILLSSLSALLYQNSEVKAEPNEIKNNGQFDIDKLITHFPKNDLSLKLRLRLNNSGEIKFDSHRSHRSHSSHRSHYSSQGGHYSHFSSSTGTSGGSSGGGSSISSTPSGGAVKTQTQKVYSLGDRTLYKGMKGADVTELVNILISKNYLKFNDASSKAYGEYEYDETIFDAVKQFQKNYGITSDGIVGSTTVYYLKN